jgi:hypothetical protein
MKFVAFYKELLPKKVKLHKNYEKELIRIYKELIEKDKRETEEIYEICQWMVHNDYWYKFILTPDTLIKISTKTYQKYYDMMYLQMQAEKMKPKENGKQNKHEEIDLSKMDYENDVRYF